MERLLILSAVCYIAAAYVSYDNYRVYKIYVDSKEKISTFRDIEAQIPSLDVWGENRLEQRLDVMVSPEDEEEFIFLLQEGGIETELLINNVEDLIQETRTVSSNDTEYSGFNWTVYHPYETIVEWLETLPELYPESVEVFSVGKSYLGVDIKGARVALNPSATRIVLFEAGIHAREWISPATTTYILNALLTTTDERVKQVAESVIWYFVPVLNPDGYNRTFHEDRLHRKNVQELENSNCSYFKGGPGIGTDLNRNFDFKWMEVGGASDDPCHAAFAGPYPFSAPETAAFKQLIDEIAGDLELYISVHSFSQLLLFPYGHTVHPIDNYYEQYAIGRMAMDAIEEYSGMRYTVGNVAEAIYIATGTSIDWVKGVYETRLAYAYELRDNGTYGFLLPEDQIIDTSEEVLASLVVLVEQLFRLDKVTFMNPPAPPPTAGSSILQSSRSLILSICLLIITYFGFK